MKQKNLVLSIVVIFMALLLSACGPPTQRTDTGVMIESKIDTQLYEVVIQMMDLKSYTHIHSYISGAASMYGGGFSGVTWQEGKGIVRGMLVYSDPEVDFAKAGDEMILKTTDYKVTALRPGDTVSLLCTADYEPVCTRNENNNGQAGNCSDLWEFDYCRLNKILSVEKTDVLGE